MVDIFLSIVFCGFVFALLALFRKRFPTTLCHGIPTIGPSNVFSSFITLTRFYYDAPAMLIEGHTKYRGRPFQIPHATNWVVYITQPDLIRDLVSFSSDQLSLMDATNEILQVHYTGIQQEQEIINVVRKRLSRNLATIVPDLFDETSHALSRIVPSAEEWTKFPVYAIASQLASQVVARPFVGPQKAQDKTYTQLCNLWVDNVIRNSVILNAVPSFLKSFCALFTNSAWTILRDARLNLQPLIEERLEDSQSADSVTHSDILSSLISLDPAVAASDSDLLIRKLLSVNFAAVHTTSTALTHVMFYLADRPEYVEKLREEISQVILEYGATKHALEQMKHLDSFLKETLRLAPVSAVNILRKVLQPVTLSDGSYLPRGTMIMGSGLPSHWDEKLYPSAMEFDPFRFSEGTTKTSSSLVNPSLEYFPFGYGPLACPGRHIAVALLKTITARLILDFDFKLVGPHPGNKWTGILSTPSRKHEVLLKRRVSV